jgi:hypothetical protein
MSGGNFGQIHFQESSLAPNGASLDNTADPQDFISKNFSEEELEVLKSRREFVDAMTATKTRSDAEAVVQFGSKLLKDGLRLQGVDYATVLMFAINQQTINVVLADYSVVHFKYETEAELSRDLETWTNGDRAKLHIPGTHAEPESVFENSPEQPIQSSAGDD